MHRAAPLRPITIFRSALIALLLLSDLSCKNSSSGHEPKIASPNTLTDSSSADAKRILPPLASDSASGGISGLIFNGLVKYDKNLVLVGELAETWEIKQGGLEIIFHLRKGVKWQDGSEFTADDVVFTYKTVTDPKVPTPYGNNYGPIEKVEAIDPYTVRAAYKEKFAPALESWGMGIIPKHLLEGKDVGSEEFNRHPVGTGPYKMKEWVTGQRIVLEANDTYFEGRPKIDAYVFRIIPDSATSLLELKSGGIDLMGLTPSQYTREAQGEFYDRYFRKIRYPAFQFVYMGYNLRDPKFSDVRVRRAITHAINKKDIIDGVMLGLGRPATGPFPPESWAYDPNVQDPGYSVDKSRALLKEAGWEPGQDGIMQKNGAKFSFTVITNQGNEPRLMSAQIIKEQLKAVGIDMNIKVLEWQAMLHEFIDKRRFEAVIMGWSLSRDPDIYDIWHSSKTKEGEFNFISYSNPEVDRLLLDGRSTFDLPERTRIYHRIHELIANDQPYTFLYVPDSLPIINKRFKGIEPAPIGIMHNLIQWSVPADKAQWYQ